MATPAVTPSMPSAPSAPSAPAAPVSAPAAPSSAPVTPASPTPAAPATPEITPGSPAPAAPTTPFDPKTSPTAPKNTDYPNTPDGQTKFLSEHRAWKNAHPDGEKPAATPPASGEAAPADLPAPEATLNPDAPPAAPQPPADTPATPQALTDMMRDVPEFGEFLKTDAGKKVQGKIFQTARRLAEIEPIAKVFPTAADAEFAQEYSSAMVGLKTASMRLIDNPDSAGDFMQVFDQQFQRLDANGQPIMENGKPVFDADRDVVRNAIFSARLNEVRSPLTQQMTDLKVKLAGAYPSDFARAQDQEKLDNLSYAESALGVVDGILDGSFFESAPPEPPSDATPEQKQWFENQKADLAKQKKDFDDQKRGASKEERTAASAKFTSDVRTDMGTAAGTVIGNALKAVQDSGVYIPAFYMQEKHVNPETGQETKTSAIGARMFMTFENDLMKPGSRTLMEITQHELLPQNDQTRQIRKDYYARKAAEMMPAIVQKEVDRIQGLVKLDQEQQAALTAKRNQVAQPEPSSGGSSLPQGASRDQVLKAAETAASQDKDWNQLSPEDKQTRLMTHFNRMRAKK